MKKISVVAAAVMIMWGTAAKAVDTQNVFISFELPYTFNLDWNFDGSNINLTGANAITPAEIAAGAKYAIPGGELLVTANANYNLSVLAESEFLTGGGDIKPASDIKVTLNGGEPSSISGLIPVVIASGTPEATAPKTLEYQIMLSPTDALGTYTTVLTYTLAAQ